VGEQGRQVRRAEEQHRIAVRDERGGGVFALDLHDCEPLAGNLPEFALSRPDHVGIHEGRLAFLQRLRRFAAHHDCNDRLALGILIDPLDPNLSGFGIIFDPLARGLTLQGLRQRPGQPVAAGRRRLLSGPGLRLGRRLRLCGSDSADDEGGSGEMQEQQACPAVHGVFPETVDRACVRRRYSIAPEAAPLLHDASGGRRIGRAATRLLAAAGLPV